MFNEIKKDAKILKIPIDGNKRPVRAYSTLSLTRLNVLSWTWSSYIHTVPTPRSLQQSTPFPSFQFLPSVYKRILRYNVPTSITDRENTYALAKPIIRRWCLPDRRCHCNTPEQRSPTRALPLLLLLKSGRNLSLLRKGGCNNPIIYLYYWFPPIFLTFRSPNTPNFVRFTPLYTEQSVGSRLPAVATSKFRPTKPLCDTRNIASRTHTL